jgi:hypothetical protein
MRVCVAAAVALLCVTCAAGSVCEAQLPPQQAATFNATRSVTASCFDKFWVADGRHRYYFSIGGATVHAAVYSAAATLVSPPNPVAELVAGDAGDRAVQDGNLTAARFADVMAMAAFSDATGAVVRVLYIMDARRMRRLDLLGGTVSTVAGSAASGYANGVGSAASFLGGPTFLYVTDSGGAAIFVSQPTSNCVRLLRPSTGAVALATGVCGTPAVLSDVDTVGRFARPSAVTLDAAREVVGPAIYIADNARRKVFVSGNSGVRLVARFGSVKHVSQLAWGNANTTTTAGLVALSRDDPCKVFHVIDGELVPLGASAATTQCRGEGHDVVSLSATNVLVAHGGAVSQPLWRLTNCRLATTPANDGEATAVFLGTWWGIALLVGAIALLLALIGALGAVAWCGRSVPDDEQKSTTSSSCNEPFDGVFISPSVTSTSDDGTANSARERRRSAFCVECCTAIAAKQFQRMRFMGRGAAGTVYSVVLNAGVMVAVKQIDLVGDEADVLRQTADIEREVEMLSRLRHPNIVTYYGAVVDMAEFRVNLVMELVAGGSLGSLVRSQGEPLDEQVARNFLFQIVRGLAALHARGVAHRDLKCDNVLIHAERGTVKLADFGTAKCIAGLRTTAAHTFIGTPLFIAPEIIAGDAFNLLATDIWSLGILAIELFDCGNLPWPNFTSAAHAFVHIGGVGVPVIPNRIPAPGAEWIRRCTSRVAADRPTAADLLMDPWFNGVRT